jgi:hypothetical protein
MRAHKVDEQNDYMLWRQRNFRLAAEYVAKELALVPSVQKVALVGRTNGLTLRLAILTMNRQWTWRTTKRVSLWEPVSRHERRRTQP